MIGIAQALGKKCLARHTFADLGVPERFDLALQARCKASGNIGQGAFPGLIVGFAADAMFRVGKGPGSVGRPGATRVALQQGFAQGQ
ncbi:hypothetical protein D3C84_293370 [compost metagenome]